MSSTTGQPAVHDPRARISELDCVHLRVTITLDNSRSTGPATFRIFHWVRVHGVPQGYTDDFVDVEAGKSTVQEMPLDDRAENDYQVEDIATHTDLADSGYQLCDARPHITIGHPDCGTLSVKVVLDNSRSATVTTFRVSGPVSSTQVVPAGRAVSQDYPLTDDSYNQLSVSVDELGIFAQSASIFCGTKPKVTIGAFDCSHLAATVTVDNSRTKGSFVFAIGYWYSFTDHGEEAESLTAGPGSVVSVHVPLADNAYTNIVVSESVHSVSDGVKVSSRGLCGLEPGRARVTVGQAACETGSFDVAVDNRQTPPRRAQHSVFMVASTRWPQDRHAYHQVLELRSDAQATFRATVPALHGGRLRVTGYPGWWGGNNPDAVLFIGTVRSDCHAQGPLPRVPSAAAARPTTAELARTGGPDSGAVPLGLLMTVTGAGAIWLSRRSAG